MVVCGCDSATSPSTVDPTDSARYESPRLTAEIPEGWDTTEAPLSGLINPVLLLSAASFDLDGARSHANCTPVRALEAMPPDGALVVVLAYGDDDLSEAALRSLPRRPDHLRLGPASFGSYECSGRSYDLQFRERNRGYKINVWLDPARVDPEIRREAVELLNGLELRPGP